MHCPAFFQLTRGATDTTSSGDFYGSIKYRIFDCLQKDDENLVARSQSARHRFAVLYREGFSHELMATFTRASRLGGISPVKLIDASKNSLYIFLDSKVTSSSVAAIESIWLKVARSGRNGHLEVHFASESEIWSGHSDYDFLSAAKEVLESHPLGMIHNSVPTPGVHNSKKICDDDFEMQTSLEQPAPAPSSPSAVRYLFNAAEFSRIVKASLGHKSEPSILDYLPSPKIMGACLNHLSSKQMAVLANYLRCVDCTAKPFLRKNKADRA